jgi:hypothetical protein
MGMANGDQPVGASSDKLRHVESLSQLPSGAGKISGINALVLGESLAAEEHDLIFPSPEFSANALVSSPQQVRSSSTSRRSCLSFDRSLSFKPKSPSLSTSQWLALASGSKAFALALSILGIMQLRKH